MSPRPTSSARGQSARVDRRLEPGPKGRALRIGLLNLMPDPATTEAQFEAVLRGGPHPVRLEPLRLEQTRGRAAAYLAAHSRPWREVLAEGLDGVIVTGAPVETLAFEEVTYWSELCAFMDNASGRVARTLYICWSAQAALWHFHGVRKRLLPAKAFGVYRQRVLAASPLLAGLATGIAAPVSRHTEVLPEDMPEVVLSLADSPASGLCLAAERDGRSTFMFNHLEYEAGTLVREHSRDRAAGKASPAPFYEVGRPGVAFWRPQACRFFGNWVDDVARATRQGGALNDVKRVRLRHASAA